MDAAVDCVNVLSYFIWVGARTVVYQENVIHITSNSVNFLDLSITRNPTHLGIGIYRKPTTTDTTINFRSNHPLEHKMAAYNFLIRRMLTLPLNAFSELGNVSLIIKLNQVRVV